MAFLKWQIRNQKLLEAEVDIDNFIEEQGISDSALIYEIVFDKKVFKTKAEVKEWLRDKFYDSDNIADNGDTFTAIIANVNQLDLDTVIEMELRRGVMVKAADLRPAILDDHFLFNAQREVAYDLSLKANTIDLSEGIPHIIEICRVIEGTHPSYGTVKITEDDLQSMERNFKEKITGVDMAVNEDHKKSEAFGWFKDVFLSFDGNVLYGQISWNTKGNSALSEKDYRYFSPEIDFNYVHPLNGIEAGTTLLGGALTNYPFLKMDAIVELNTKTQRGKVMNEKTIPLHDHQAQVIDLSTKISDLEKSEAAYKSTIDGMKVKEVELSTKVDDLQKKFDTQEREAKNKKLFDDNKINAAQLVALNEGKPFEDILALGTKLNPNAKGDGGNPPELVELSDKDLAMAKKVGLTPEKYAEYNGLK